MGFTKRKKHPENYRPHAWLAQKGGVQTAPSAPEVVSVTAAPAPRAEKRAKRRTKRARR